MITLGVIPARYNSTRLPGKPLADICGKTMIQRVYERASRSTLLDRLIVATDDERIVQAVNNFGGEAMLTSPNHTNGTSRVVEIAKKFSNNNIVINIQGDEPLLNPCMIDEVISLFYKTENRATESATICALITDTATINDPSVVKVAFRINGDALYFSRSPIPFIRDPEEVYPIYRHIGIYGFTRRFLIHYYAKMPQTPLASAESLEQLRILEHGFSIKVEITRAKKVGPSVDTPADLEAVRCIINSGKENEYDEIIKKGECI